jgi:membrane protein DedA with SNARE-associated domain
MGHLMGYNKEIKESLNKHFEKHTAKTLLLAKFSHGIGSIVQVTAGMTKVNFSKYLSIQTIGTIPKTLVLFLIGIYIGESYLKINDYMHLIAYIVFGIVSLILIYFILNKYLKNYFK